MYLFRKCVNCEVDMCQVPVFHIMTTFLLNAAIATPSKISFPDNPLLPAVLNERNLPAVIPVNESYVYIDYSESIQVQNFSQVDEIVLHELYSHNSYRVLAIAKKINETKYKMDSILEQQISKTKILAKMNPCEKYPVLVLKFLNVRGSVVTDIDQIEFRYYPDLVLLKKIDDLICFENKTVVRFSPSRSDEYQVKYCMHNPSWVSNNNVLIPLSEGSNQIEDVSQFYLTFSVSKEDFFKKLDLKSCQRKKGRVLGGKVEATHVAIKSGVTPTIIPMNGSHIYVDYQDSVQIQEFSMIDIILLQEQVEENVYKTLAKASKHFQELEENGETQQQLVEGAPLLVKMDLCERHPELAMKFLKSEGSKTLQLNELKFSFNPEFYIDDHASYWICAVNKTHILFSEAAASRFCITGPKWQRKSNRLKHLTDGINKVNKMPDFVITLSISINHSIFYYKTVKLDLCQNNASLIEEKPSWEDGDYEYYLPDKESFLPEDDVLKDIEYNIIEVLPYPKPTITVINQSYVFLDYQNSVIIKNFSLIDKIIVYNQPLESKYEYPKIDALAIAYKDNSDYHPILEQNLTEGEGLHMYLDPCKQYSTLILKFLKTHFYTDTLLNQIEFSYDPIEAIDVNVDSWICSENSTSVRLSINQSKIYQVNSCMTYLHHFKNKTIKEPLIDGSNEVLEMTDNRLTIFFYLGTKPYSENLQLKPCDKFTETIDYQDKDRNETSSVGRNTISLNKTMAIQVEKGVPKQDSLLVLIIGGATGSVCFLILSLLMMILVTRRRVIRNEAERNRVVFKDLNPEYGSAEEYDGYYIQSMITDENEDYCSSGDETDNYTEIRNHNEIYNP